MGTLAPANSQIEETFLIKKNWYKIWTFLKTKDQSPNPILNQKTQNDHLGRGPDFSPEDVKHKISSSIVS